jgi:hypothetical protein
MKNAIVRKFPRAVRVAAIASISFVALLFAACNMNAPGGGAALANARSLVGAKAPAGGAAASSFTVLGNQAVTLTDATVTGSVGTFLPPAPASPAGSVTTTRSTITGSTDVGDAASIAAYNAFLAEYAALAPKLGDVYTETLTGTLDGVTLAPGVYSSVAAVTVTGGVLTLKGPSNGIWIFKIGTTGGTQALTGTSFSVVMAGGATPSNVTWWVAQAVTMTDSNFQGTILAGAAITLTRGTFNGNAWAGASKVGDVTITGTTITGCAGSSSLPACKDFVTGGGSIDTDNDAHGHHNAWWWNRSKASFGVSGGIKNGKLWGQFSFNDHNGVKVKSTAVTNYIVIDAVTREIDGTAKVNGRGSITYKVVVADNGPGGRHDTFRVDLSNSYSASGTLSGGNIMLHRDCGVTKDDHGRDNDRENYKDNDEDNGNANCDRDRD